METSYKVITKYFFTSLKYYLHNITLKYYCCHPAISQNVIRFFTYFRQPIHRKICQNVCTNKNSHFNETTFSQIASFCRSKHTQRFLFFSQSVKFLNSTKYIIYEGIYCIKLLKACKHFYTLDSLVISSVVVVITLMIMTNCWWFWMG